MIWFQCAVLKKKSFFAQWWHTLSNLQRHLSFVALRVKCFRLHLFPYADEMFCFHHSLVAVLYVQSSTKKVKVSGWLTPQQLTSERQCQPTFWKHMHWRKIFSKKKENQFIFPLPSNHFKIYAGVSLDQVRISFW